MKNPLATIVAALTASVAPSTGTKPHRATAKPTRSTKAKRKAALQKAARKRQRNKR